MEDGPPLVGRDRELERLVVLLDAACAGTAGSAVIAGEAGIGKTRLAREAIDAAAAQEARVLLGEAIAMDMPPAYLPIAGALRCLLDERTPVELADLAGPWAGHLAVVLPELRSVVEPADRDDRSAVFAAVRDLLERTTRERLTVLLIDDLHLADPASLDLLAYLVRTARGRLAILMTCRQPHEPPDVDMRRWIGELERVASLQRITLGPLESPALRSLVEQITGSAPRHDRFEHLATAAGGNPLYLQELLTAPDDGRTIRLDDLLALRLDGLGPQARAVVDAVAVAGGRAPESALGVVTGMPAHEVEAGQRGAVAANVLVEEADGGALMFRHGLLAETALGRLLSSERARLHTAWADVLDEDPDPTAETLAAIAYHRDASGDRSRALSAALVAAEASERSLAHETAEQNYERALRLSTGSELDGRDRHTVLERAANAAFMSGDADRAAGWLREALDEVADPDRTAYLHALMGQYEHFAGDPAAAARALDRARDMVMEGPPTPTRAHVLRLAALVTMLTDRTDEAIPLCEEGIAAARAVEVPEVEAFLLGILGVSVASETGEVDAALDHIRAGKALADELDDPELGCRLSGNEAMVLTRAGRYEEALTRAGEVVERSDRGGFRHRYGVPARLYRMQLEHLLGRWEDAERTAQEVEGLHPAPALRPHVLTQRAQLDVGRGRFDRAARDLDEADAYESGDAEAVIRAANLRAELEIWSGRTESARAIVAGILDRPLPSGTRAEVARTAALGLRAEADLAWSSSVRGDRDAARAIGERTHGLSLRLEAIASDLRLASVAAWRTTGVAELARALGDDDETSRWEAVVDAWDELEVPHLAAYGRYRLAEALSRSGHASAEAEEQLRAALSTGRDLGADPLVDEITALARRARIDLTPVPSEPDGPSAPDPLDGLGLTPREREVLELLAAGHTNRAIAEQLFVTEKTIERHVTNILRKLDVTNRVQAATIVHHREAGSN